MAPIQVQQLIEGGVNNSQTSLPAASMSCLLLIVIYTVIIWHSTAFIWGQLLLCSLWCSLRWLYKCGYNLRCSENSKKYGSEGPTIALRIMKFKSCIAYSLYKTSVVILQLIGIIITKSKETRVVTYTCRYSSGPLIPNSSWHNWIKGIKCPLE